MVTVDAIVYSIAPAGGIAVQFNELLTRLPANGITFEAYRFCQEGLSFPTFAVPARRLERYRRFGQPSAGELFHSTYYRLPSRKHRRVFTTVHDFIYERYADGPRRWVHSWQKYKAIRASDVVVCVSEQTKQDLLHFLPEVKAKTLVSRAGARSTSRRASQSLGPPATQSASRTRWTALCRLSQGRALVLTSSVPCPRFAGRAPSAHGFRTRFSAKEMHLGSGCSSASRTRSIGSSSRPRPSGRASTSRASRCRCS